MCTIKYYKYRPRENTVSNKGQGLIFPGFILELQKQQHKDD